MQADTLFAGNFIFSLIGHPIRNKNLWWMDGSFRLGCRLLCESTILQTAL